MRNKHLIFAACLYLLVGLFASFRSAAQSGVQYVYDGAGRLTGVIDGSGNAVAYNYDSLGNILSISRYASSQVSVINFSPKSGPSGTVVTITGTGYSSTVGQDGVQLNGVSASINSATVNQIVVVVPSGATTGPIKVTAPSGTFTTQTNFIVTSGSAPSISSFTPTIAAAGTAINVSGSNFDPNASNDRLSFNTTEQLVASATTTTLSTSVPTAAGSGRLTLLTSGGISQSNQYLFIPFGSHVAGDVGFTGQSSLPGTVTITLSSRKKIALLVFDAIAGHSLSVSMGGSTFKACTLYLFSPTAVQLASTGCTTGITSFGPVNLSMNGTYTIGLDPSGNTGSINLALN